MVCALIAIEVDSYKRRRRLVQAADIPLFNFVMRIMNYDKTPDETLYCQVPCIASDRDILNSIKELITFRRPCLQYPLSKFWWQLEALDFEAKNLSAKIQYPEEEGRNISGELSNKLVWALEKNAQNETLVRLDWFCESLVHTRYKMSILLSMIAYTEERLRRLNEIAETQATVGNTMAISGTSPQRQLLLGSNDGQINSALLEAVSESAAWPSPQDYNEAIQSPRICFTDVDLAAGEVEENTLGIPKAVSGAFASVYRVHGQDRDWAVRCFLTPVKDQQARYSILSKHLSKDTDKRIIDFSFLEKGMHIQNKFFPVLKMEWVDGLALNFYVESILEQPEMLRNLRREFQEMISDLRAAKIAHGDLQHGNILVRDGRLVLVDYDGMFVPELVRFQSAELGHPNYQHPRRDGKHFGLFLDNFAGWLIDTSLLCLEEDPRLWQKFNGGDECLLFRRNDLSNPEKSKLFQELRSHESARIRTATDHFLTLLQLELEEIPFLEAVG
jgi:hypothetical protein